MRIRIQDWLHPSAVGTVILLSYVVFSTAQAEDSLNPRISGDWSHENAPLPTYRDCHPAMTACQLPVRPITKDESDLNQRTNSDEHLRSPSPPIITPREGSIFGPEIGDETSLNKNSIRIGPAIQK